MAGYTRQSTYTDGDIITAAHTNDEFNQLLAAFVASTGHSHDGTAGDGGPVTTLRDTDANNKIVVDTDNNHLEFYVEVSSSATQQLRIQDGAIVPITDDDIDLGTSSLEFKDLHLDGTANIDSLVADTADINGGTIDGVTLGTNSAVTQAVIDNININGATIGHTDDTDLLTLASGILTVAGEISVTTLDIGGTNVTSTAAELNILDGVTATATELNILDGVTSTTAELNILDGVTSTAAEINIIDGNTSATSTTVADADRVVLNDNGTMVQVAVTDLDTYFSATTKTLTNKTLTTPVIAEIDNSSNITLDAGGDIILDADGANVIFKDGGTSILDIANNSSDVELTVSTADKNFAIKGTDGSSAITALDIDMALAGKATFSGDVVVTGDLTISGDDLIMGTNTSGHIMVADGTNFNPVAVSGDVTIASNGAVTIANSAVETAMLNANVISGQSAETSLDTSNDTLLMFDNSASGLKKITLATLSSGLGGLSDISGDSTPQLGGDLDVNGNAIVSASNGNIALTPNGTGVVRIDGSNGIDMQSGSISIKNSGSQSYVDFYCESSNAHYARLQAPAHSAFSGNITLTLPATTDTLTGIAATQTLTNKTLTSPKINEDVAVTATATEINILDGVTSTTAELNILDGVTSTAAELNYVDVTTLGTVEASKAVTADSSGDVTFPDNEKLKLGTGDDLQIYHTGSNSIIQDAGTGALILMSNTYSFRNAANDEQVAVFNEGGSIELYHNNSKKFETASTGATVTGELKTTTLEIGGTDVTSTAAEINIIDGDTSATSTTLADADRFVTNDNGTMKQVALTDVKTYLTSAGFSSEDPTALAIALG